jgi:hypothetical protein
VGWYPDTMMTTERPWRFIASNLHSGGGVQVAASLLDEVAQLTTRGEWQGVAGLLECEASSQVIANLRPATVEKLRLNEINRRPSHLGSKWRDARATYASTFTVFGPLYSAPRAHHRIMGYADVTSVYPDPVARESPVPDSVRARQSLRSQLSQFEATRQDVLVVETDAMKTRLSEVLEHRCPRVAVVPNAVNARVIGAKSDVRILEMLERERRTSELLLSYPTRAYAHKNLDFLPFVGHQLMCRGLLARFVVTLREDEWAAQTPDFRNACVNVGEATIDQVATVMRGTDGVFFPSLLEAYSATPLEALALRVPLFASDRDFVRSICGDAAIYFDPRDAAAAADAVIRAIADADGADARGRLGMNLIGRLPSATDRAHAILSLMAEEGEKR